MSTDTDYRRYTTAELRAMPADTHIQQQDYGLIAGYVDWYKSDNAGRWQSVRRDARGWCYVISNSELSRRKLRRIA